MTGVQTCALPIFKNAKICYEKAAAINTLLYNSYYNLAQINFIYNDLEEAEKCYMKSLESEELEPEAYYQLAKIYVIRGDKENAIKFLNVAIEIDAHIYKKAEAEPLFIPIKPYIHFPNLEEVEPRKQTLTQKEKKAKKHLEETTKLVGKLSHNDQKIKKNRDKEKENQREREE